VLDGETNKTLWRDTAPLLGGGLLAGPWMLVETIGGQLRALDRHTGQLIWSYSFGVPFDMRVVPQSQPRWLVVDTEDGKLSAFDLQHPRLEPRPNKTTIRGRVRPQSLRWRSPPKWVLVGHEPVPVQKNGRFKTQVHGAGRIRVTTVAHNLEPAKLTRDDCPYPTEVLVPLDGETHKITLEVGFGGCD
jgi:hypothetical protein